MVSPELVEWVNKYLAAGYGAEQLYSYLLEQGYSEEDVRGALDSALKTGTPGQGAPLQQGAAQDSQQINPQGNTQSQNTSSVPHPNNSLRTERPKKKKKVWLIIIIIVVVLLLIAGGYFGYKMYFAKAYIFVDPEIGAGAGPGDVIITNGGSGGSNSLSSPVECFDQACFDAKFASCSPSFFLMVLQPQMSQHYEILGMEGNYCKVSSYYENHPSQEWVGPQMTCFFDNTLSFQEASNDITRCGGPLFELIIGQ
ncbi:MAG: hypothetical protein ACP5N3_03935 [Candidatus Nanoarchaeia archaeon]